MTDAPLLRDVRRTQLVEDSVVTIDDKRTYQEQLMLSPPAATSQHPVQRDVDSFDIDEAQLLAETEELLGSLDPIAFVDTRAPATERLTSAVSRRSFSSSSTIDSSGDDSCVSSQSPSTQPHPASKCGRKRALKPGAMRNPSRERLQNELASLRQQVLVLENELQDAQQRNERSNSSTQLVALVPMWERVAKRQLAACDRTVRDNKRLKSIIDLQKELVVGMEESLYNWQHGAALPPALSPGDLTPFKSVRLEQGDDLLFELLVSELDATFMRIDEAFQEAGLDQVGIEPFKRDTPKTVASSDGMLQSYFEMVEVEISPFDYEMIHRVAKICAKKQSQSPDCTTYHHNWGQGYIITEKHRIKRVFNGVEIYFHMLLALKEFVLEDQVVCVWRSMFKSVDHHYFPDAYVQERGWMTSTNLVSSNSSGKASTLGSITKVCIHLEPKRFDAPNTVIQADDDTMTTLVLNSYEADMQEMNDMMENMLIQETSQSRSILGVSV